MSQNCFGQKLCGNVYSLYINVTSLGLMGKT